MNIFPNLRSLVRIAKALERIAHSLEIFLELAYDYHVQAPKADKSGPSSDVLYADDFDTEVQRRLDQIHGKDSDWEDVMSYWEQDD